MWKRREIKFVDENLGKMTYRQIAEVLGKSHKSIYYCVKTLLQKSIDKKAWCYKEAEDDFIKKNYRRLTDKEMSEKIGRTEASVKQRRIALRLVKVHRKPKHQQQAPPILPEKKVKRTPKRQEGAVWEREIISRFGVVYRYKMTKQNGKIIYYHRYIWELSNPPLSNSEIVRFKNNDTTDCRLENLYVCSRKASIKDNQNQKKSWSTRKGKGNDLYERILNGYDGYAR